MRTLALVVLSLGVILGGCSGDPGPDLPGLSAGGTDGHDSSGHATHGTSGHATTGDEGTSGAGTTGGPGGSTGGDTQDTGSTGDVTAGETTGETSGGGTGAVGSTSGASTGAAGTTGGLEDECGIDAPCPGGDVCIWDEGSCGEWGHMSCQFVPGICTKEFDPVCGCNGTTYDNPCVAHSAGQSIEHHGPC